jgi:hypothetical protein
VIAAQCPQLSKLLLSNCSITSEGVRIAMTSALPLLELDLSYCRRVREDCIEHIMNGRCRNKLRKLSFEGMLWLQLSHLQNLLDSCPALTTLFAAGCDSVRGTPNIPRFDLTVYLNAGPIFRRPPDA